MVEDLDKSDPPTKPLRYGRVVSLGGQEDRGFIVRYELVIRTQSLMIGAYSPYQIELSDKVILLRDSEKLTYKAIADLLIAQGYKSPRGYDLGPESVFSIYKKRKIRDRRLSATPRMEIKNIEIVKL